jgi:hypothetical protein
MELLSQPKLRVNAVNLVLELLGAFLTLPDND